MSGNIDMATAILGTEALRFYDLNSNREMRALALSVCDGNRFWSHADGRVRAVNYASGIEVVRHDRFVMVKALDWSHWLGDSNGRWYRID